FVSLDAPVAVQQASGSDSGAGVAVSAPSAEENVVEENVILEGTFLDLTDPESDVAVVERDVAQKQPEKAKRKKLLPCRVADAPVYTTVDTVTSSRGKMLVVPTSDVGGSSHPETSEESADSFYETAALNSEDAKR
ncbi:hypothetical protein Tco_0243715, partial [Tanacetum coccineum]